MLLTAQTALNNSTKKKQRETGQQQPRMVRLTVSLPGDFIDRLHGVNLSISQNGAYWFFSLWPGA